MKITEIYGIEKGIEKGMELKKGLKKEKSIDTMNFFIFL